MTRDMELARKILLELEACPDARGPNEFEIEGYDSERVSYHIKLLRDAGLLEATDTTTYSGYEWFPTALTWHGHEFLDAVRNDTIWKKTTAVIKAQGGSMPFEIVKAVAIQLLRVAVGV